MSSASNRVAELRSARPRTSRLRSAFAGRYVLLLGLAAFCVVLLFIPFYDVVRTSLAPGLSGHAYRGVLDVAGYRRILINTAEISAITTVISLVIAVPFAHFMWNRGTIGRLVCLVIIFIPFFTGILVKNLSWSVVLQDNGVLNTAFKDVGLPGAPYGLMFTRTAVIVGMVHYLLPFAVIPIYAKLVQMDRTLLAAARSLGAGPLTGFRLVTLPLIKGGIVTAAVIVFVAGLGFFVTPAMLGGPRDQMVANVISVFVNQLGDFTSAAVFAVLLGGVVLVLMPLALREVREGSGGASALFVSELQAKADVAGE